VTLGELLVSLVMFAIVMTAIMTVFTGQQRLFSRTREAADVQRDLRMGFSMLPADLRAAAPRPVAGLGNSDLGELSDSGLSVRATIGQSIVCERANVATNQIVLPPLNLANHTLTTWHSTPDSGDVVLLYNDSLRVGPEDDYWLERTLVKIDTVNQCLGLPFTDAVKDLGKKRLRLTLDANVDTTVHVGAGVRFLRWSRYSLFRPGGPSAPTGTQWYLGYSERSKAGVWTAREPIAGPFRAYSATNSGILFQYFDSTNTALTAPIDPTRVRRIDLTLRAQARVRGAGASEYSVRDSLAMRVAMRNGK
jgi:hypothetical protein